MSPYLVVLIMLVVFAIYEYRKGKRQDGLYWIAFSVLGMMLCFRYAQGTDYYGYYINYLQTPEIWDPIKLITTKIHGEVGWTLLCSICRGFAVPFPALVFVISIFEMYCIHRFISGWCPLRVVALALMYPTIYLTYTMSTLRQGMVLLFFLGFMLQWICQNKWKRYLIATFVCALFHSSAVVFLVLFAVYWIRLDGKTALILVALSAGCGWMCSFLLPKISSVFATYAYSSFSIMAIGERVASLAVILYIFWGDLKRKEHTKLWLLLQVYLYSMIIYAFLMWNALISSRFNIYFKAVEIMLFTTALIRPERFPGIRCHKRDAVAVYLLLLMVVMYFKNINSYIIQGEYVDEINVINYPYLTIFNISEARIWRAVPYDFFGYLHESGNVNAVSCDLPQYLN